VSKMSWKNRALLQLSMRELANLDFANLDSEDIQRMEVVIRMNEWYCTHEYVTLRTLA